MTDEGYGYVEVPSMTAEYFLRDVDMLLAYATPKDGHLPTREQLATWIVNHEINQGVSLLARAGSALYDIELWDYDYTAPGAKTYIQRAEEVFHAIDLRTNQPQSIEASAPTFYANMATTHFVVATSATLVTPTPPSQAK